MQLLNASVLGRVALSVVLVVLIVGCSGQANTIVVHQVSQAASTGLTLRGAYTFVMQVDPDGACGWPVTTFYWPVSMKVTSHEQGTALGSIVFPPTSVSSSNTWSISAGPTRTQLVPRQESPGPAGGAYDVVVDGGRWEAGGAHSRPRWQGGDQKRHGQRRKTDSHAAWLRQAVGVPVGCEMEPSHQAR